MAAPGKVTLMLGAFVHENYHGAFHGKAVNLARKLCEEYDKGFESYDVLVLPTIIKKPPKAMEKDEMDFGKSRTKILFISCLTV